MSWSISGRIGKAPGVRAAVAKEFEQSSKCAEPEETIRQAAKQIIDAALAAQGENQVVEVSASGSQSTSGITVVSNSVNIKVQPVWGFIE
jgi:hypothetical protein